MAYAKWDTVRGSSHPTESDERLDYIETGIKTMSDDLVALEGQAGLTIPASIELDFVVADMTDNLNTTGYIDFAAGSLPANALVLGTTVVTSAGFTGDTSAVIQVGVSGDLDRFSADVAKSVFAPGTVAFAPIAADVLDGYGATQTPRVTITSATDFTAVKTADAGAAVVTIWYTTIG